MIVQGSKVIITWSIQYCSKRWVDLAKHVLLVEPNYYSKFPPLGLLKLSSYHKSNGDTTELVKSCEMPKRQPDLIYVTSLFTWAWKPVWIAVEFCKRKFPNTEVHLGGLYASLLPKHAASSGADVVYEGIFEEAEGLMPDYELVEKWDGSIIFSSRGCLRKCPFCAVPKIEGSLKSVKKSIKEFVYHKHTSVIFWDNNILAASNWRSVFDELEELNLNVDFNQGLDARLITDEVANRLSRLKLNSGSSMKVRLGYDSKQSEEPVKKAIERLHDVGINGRRIMVYTLFNYNDDPEEFFLKVRNILEWGAVCYPMRYEPLDIPFALEKNKYISPKWEAQLIEMVHDARRVIGFGGAFPPYQGLIEKFQKARSFEEAFALRPKRA
jgi:hypothetical protein